MIKMLRKTKKVLAAVLTAGMLVAAVSAPVVAATEGWKKNSIGWWYQNVDGSFPANQWKKINGAWYYFNVKGYMLENEWTKDMSGKWYYLGANGTMKTNTWVQDKAGKWYYLGTDGVMKTNAWVQDKSGKWYYVGTDGVMKTSTWVQDKAGKWYYLGTDGAMKINEWIEEESGKRYYVGADGTMITDNNDNGDDDNVSSVNNATIGDLKYTVDESWTLNSNASNSNFTIYGISSDDGNANNYFGATVSESGEELSEEDIVSYRDVLIQEFENMNAVIVSETTIDTVCGTALSVTFDITNSTPNNEGLSDYTRYTKQVYLVNGTKLYSFQIYCSGDDFSTLEPEFDAVISNISK
ncbi:MAG: N-acetylmuramoyl-L-alanine amidase family protein [Lachnospiraceae bacterium]|nr:N-acetylmuramoyl-L-alanine amidase family protein [Lachnospiraceae bacterium]